MLSAEYAKRVQGEIVDTDLLLVKALKKYNDTITCLKMDIEENKELGNDKTANRAWVDYALQDKARVKQLRTHKQKLENMLNKQGAN